MYRPYKKQIGKSVNDYSFMVLSRALRRCCSFIISPVRITTL